MHSTHARMYKTSGCRSSPHHSLTKHLQPAEPTVSPARVTKGGVGWRPKTTPLVTTSPSDRQSGSDTGFCSEWEHTIRCSSGDYLPKHLTYEARAEKAHAEFVRKSGNVSLCRTCETKGSGGCYTETNIVTKTDSTGIKKVCRTDRRRRSGERAQHNTSHYNYGDVESPHRRGFSESRGISADKMASGVSVKIPNDRDVVRNRIEGSVEIRETSKRRQKSREHSMRPSPISVSTQESRIPRLATQSTYNGGTRGFHHPVTKSEEELLEKTSKVSKATILLRHIPFTTSKSRELNNKQDKKIKPISPKELKAFRRVNSSTQTSEESVHSGFDDNPDERPTDQPSPELSQSTQMDERRKTVRVELPSKSPEVRGDTKSVKRGSELLSSSKFRALRISSSNSSQETERSINRSPSRRVAAAPTTPLGTPQKFSSAEAKDTLEIEHKLTSSNTKGISAPQQEPTSAETVPLVASETQKLLPTEEVKEAATAQSPPSRSGDGHSYRPRRPSGSYVSAVAREFEEGIAQRMAACVRPSDLCGLAENSSARGLQAEAVCRQKSKVDSPFLRYQQSKAGGRSGHASCHVDARTLYQKQFEKHAALQAPLGDVGGGWEGGVRNGAGGGEDVSWVEPPLPSVPAPAPAPAPSPTAETACGGQGVSLLDVGTGRAHGNRSPRAARAPARRNSWKLSPQQTPDGTHDAEHPASIFWLEDEIYFEHRR